MLVSPPPLGKLASVVCASLRGGVASRDRVSGSMTRHPRVDQELRSSGCTRLGHWSRVVALVRKLRQMQLALVLHHPALLLVSLRFSHARATGVMLLPTL